MFEWMPQQVGTGFEFPRTLKPLELLREHVKAKPRILTANVPGRAIVQRTPAFKKGRTCGRARLTRC